MITHPINLRISWWHQESEREQQDTSVSICATVEQSIIGFTIDQPQFNVTVLSFSLNFMWKTIFRNFSLLANADYAT